MTPDATLPANNPIPFHCVHYLPQVRLDQGGVTRAVLDWCRVLASRGSSITLITYDATDVPAEWQTGGPLLPRVLVVDAPRRFAARLPAASVRAAAQVIGRADVLHLHAPWYIGNPQLASVARRHAVPYVLTAHGMLDDWCMAQRVLKKRIFLLLVGRRMLDGAAAIHCTAEEELAQAKKWFGAMKTVVLPYLVDLAPFAMLPGPELAQRSFSAFSKPGPKVLFLSRVDHKKGVELLIAAAERLQREGTEVTVLIAGPEKDPEYSTRLRRQISAAGLEEQVVFLGTITGTQKLSLFQAADIMVLPTHQENFGLALFESLACATPVVTTRGVDPWREIESAGGLIVDQTEAALAGAIRNLLQEGDDLKARGRRGRDWVMDHLDADRIAGQYEQLYRGLRVGR